MKIKALGIACGAVWALFVGWSVFLAIMKWGSVPYAFVDEFYLGWLTATWLGLLLGVAIAFIDGFIGGAIFAWIYNKLAK